MASFVDLLNNIYLKIRQLYRFCFGSKPTETKVAMIKSEKHMFMSTTQLYPDYYENVYKRQKIYDSWDSSL